MLHQPQFALIASGVSTVSFSIFFALGVTAGVKYYGKDESTAKKYMISSATFLGVCIIAYLLRKLFK